MLLSVRNLEVCYGVISALQDVSVDADRGEIVALIGANGAGKTTLLRTISGLLRPRQGVALFEDEHELTRLKPHLIVRRGVSHAPEGRQIFANLTVRENLVATAADRADAENPWTLQKVQQLFPRLAERGASMGTQLSGGEQQMLAIGRALMTNPRLLILDEATEGLAPLLRAEIWRCLTGLKAAGQAILLIDKNVEALTRIADRHYIIERGRVVWTGSSAELKTAGAVQERHLSI